MHYQRALLPAAFLFILAVLLSALAMDVRSATLPAGFTETKLLGQVNATCVDVAKDGRVFLCEKPGRIRVYKDGKWLTTPLLSVDADFQEERGLLGLALDPDFKVNPFIYVYYTAKNPVHNRISRFRVEGDVAGAETVLLDLNNLAALRSGGWHNGGALHFGKDGKLYIATGNNAIQSNSQSMDNLLGKILRINADGTIPDDNPFYKTNSGNNRAIWALGLRNPYTAAVHPVTGRLLINEVGDGAYEEIDEGKAGTNYGYPKAEGHAATPPGGLTGTYGDPIANYNHGDGCAIAGGTFYQPTANGFGTEYAGRYFYADYCGGWIKTLDPANGNAVKGFATGIPRPIFLKAAADGTLYYVCRGARTAGSGAGSAEDNQSTKDGSLYRIKGPNATSIVGERLLPGGVASGRIRIPAGKHRVTLYGLSGSKLWEFQGPRVQADTWLELPATLPMGAVRARFE